MYPCCYVLFLCTFLVLFLFCSSFASKLSKVSNKKGMRMNACPTVFYEFKSRSDDFEKVLRGKFLGLVDIVIVVLDGRQGPTYSE